MNITLPDPKDGTAVELEIDPACPMFFRAKYEGVEQWMFSPFEFDRDSAAWSHDRDFPLRVEEISNFTPIIAAVAVCWFEAELARHNADKSPRTVRQWDTWERRGNKLWSHHRRMAQIHRTTKRRIA